MTLGSEQYKKISSTIASQDDVAILSLLKDATSMHEGVGGSSSLLRIDGHTIFIKKIPLTDLERKSDNTLSTKNLFGLPLFYQYRLGSAGFGAWRELAAHQQTTEWVLSGACTSFPLLYHWRVVETEKAPPMTVSEIESLNSTVAYWENSIAIRHRLEALNSASAHLVLFCQYIPQTLHDWLASELKAGEDRADNAVLLVEREITTASAFLNANGFVHFDAHFQNILCDGKLYYSDFGLALSDQFDLTSDELEFLRNQHSYDRCVAAVSLIQSLMEHLYGPSEEKRRWSDHLKTFMDDAEAKPDVLTSVMEETIRRYAPLALTLSDFYQQLHKVSKSTLYPSQQLEQLLAEVTVHKL